MRSAIAPLNTLVISVSAQSVGMERCQKMSANVLRDMGVSYKVDPTNLAFRRLL